MIIITSDKDSSDSGEETTKDTASRILRSDRASTRLLVGTGQAMHSPARVARQYAEEDESESGEERVRVGPPVRCGRFLP